MNLKAGGLGSLGADQLAWLKNDVRRYCRPARRSCCSRTFRCGRSIPEWGWGTDDSEQALALVEAVRIGDGTQRAHSSDHAEGRRQRVVSHGAVDGVSAAGARNRAWPRPDEGRARNAKTRA